MNKQFTKEDVAHAYEKIKSVQTVNNSKKLLFTCQTGRSAVQPIREVARLWKDL